MRLSSKVTGEFIGVFFSGILVGALAMWDFGDTQLSKFMLNTNDPDSVMTARINKKYAEDYHLTPEEISRIQPLIKEMAQNISQSRQKFGHDIITTLTLYHQKIAMQLSPEHRAIYEQDSVEREKQISDLLLPDQSSPTPDQK